jgi:low affinity Fe/Cu permease
MPTQYTKTRPKPVLRFLSNFYKLVSHPYSFIFIVITIIGWFLVGYVFHFDEKWYKAFHVFEIVVALTMVFLIENTASDKKVGLEKLLKGEKME